MAAPMLVRAINDDCVLHILSYIDDFRSFYSFSLTCKQFYKVSLWTRKWHLNIVKRKTRFYAARFVIFELSSAIVCCFNTVTLAEILRWVDVCDTMKPTLENVEKIWTSRGPVAAELFLRTREYRTWRKAKENGENRPSGFVIDKRVGILLDNTPPWDPEEPSEMEFLYNEDHDCLTIKENHWVINNDEDIFEFSQYLETWDDNMEDIEPLRQIASYIQREIGPTSPSITVKFLVKSLFLPKELREINPNVDLKNEEKLFFQEKNKNNKPTNESVQNALVYWKAQWKYRRLLNFVDESSNIKEIRNLTTFLPSNVKMDDFNCTLNINELAKDFSGENLHKLMLRTSFDDDVEQYHVTEDGKRRTVVKVKATVSLIQGKEARVEMVFKFFPVTTSGKIHLPGHDGVLKVEVPSFRDFHEAQTALEPMQPLTDALKECLDYSPLEKLQLTNYHVWRYLCVIGSQDTAACSKIDWKYLWELSYRH